MNERDIFAAALDLPDAGERAAYLDHACADNVELRRHVERLLAAQSSLGSFLAQPAIVPRSTEQHEPATERPGTMIGPYKLMEQIGEGGMGLVFVAEQQQPVRRKVALKVIKPGMDTRQVVARFEAERQALALMDHPNIAKVLDGGETGSGRPYFVMELVKGVPITEFCDQNRLPTRERLDLFLHVCRAVQHAHLKGVIHRDIKPSNVLVASHDGTPVVKVIDFGVAKAIGQQLTEKTVYTQLAQLVGTPLYMSPEQAGQSSLDVDTRTDIHALGVLLYELLTGTTPFDKDRLSRVGYDELRRIIREEEPPRPSTRIGTLGPAAETVSVCRRSEPRKLSSLVRGELDWIVMKALEKDRARRYETASAFATDVERYLTDEPVQACPPSAWYRFRKFTRRNRAALVTATAAAMVVVAGVAGLVTSNFLIAREQRETKNALDDANVARAELKQSNESERVESYFRRIALAYRELSSDNLGLALKLLNECPEDLRKWEWHFLMRLCRVEQVVLRNGPTVTSLAFRADGEQIASADLIGTLKVWNSRTGKVILRIEKAHGVVGSKPGFASSVTFHPGGEYLASTGEDKLVKVWDLTTGHAVFSRPCDALHTVGTAYTVAFNPVVPNHLAVGSETAVTIWDWKNEKLVHVYPAQGMQRLSVAFSHDGRLLASGNWGGNVKLWNAEDRRELLRSFPEIRQPVAGLSFSPDAARLATASFGRSVDLWNTATGERVQQLLHSGLVLGVAFSPDPAGRLVVSTGEDKTVHVWEAESGREILGLRGHTALCGCVAFSPDGLRLASASQDGTIRVWDATPLLGHERQEILSLPEPSASSDLD